METTDFAQAMDVHMWGPLYMILAAVPHMRRQGGGRIVNIASIGGKIAVPHLMPYTASKFALVGLSDGMRTELAQDGIAVTTVCPGLMRTGSHLNALFKGQHQNEFAWFALFASLPVTSIAVRRAARQILEACRYGDAQLIITVQARLLTVLQTLFPGFMAQGLQLMQRLLPGPTWPQGDQLKRGWESRSAWAPSPLTQLADRAAVANNE
jgi:NAD(P)-dependent dehydrogenase (short-subunit alcohol dehydrogenase family)